MQLLTAALVLADEKLREELRGYLPRLPVRLVLEQPAVAQWPRFLARLKRATPDLLLIDFSQFQRLFAGAAQALKSLSPPPAIVVVHDRVDAETILKCIRAGADEFVVPPFGPSLREALGHVCRQRAEQECHERPSGQVVGFVSAKGGCGATTLACHVAVGIRQATKHEVLLADFDLQVGMVGYLMKAETPHSTLDAAYRASSLDFRSWREMVWHAQPRLDVIPAPDRLWCYGEPLDSGPFREVIRSVRAHYGWVVVDLGRGLNSISRGIVEELDRLFVVSTPDVPALFQGKQIVQSLIHSNYNGYRLRFILNRAPKHREFTKKEVHDLVGLPVYSELAESSELEQAFARAKLVAADSRPGKQLADLAMQIADVKPVEIRAQYSILGLKQLLPEWFHA